MSAISKKAFAVSALTLGGLAGATGTAFAAQEGVTTEAPSKNTTTVVDSTKSGGQGGIATEAPATKSASTKAAQVSAPAPTIAQAESAKPVASTKAEEAKPAAAKPSTTKTDEVKPAASKAVTGGQGGVSTELPDRVKESTNKDETSKDDTGKAAQAEQSAPASEKSDSTQTTTTTASIRQVAHTSPAAQPQAAPVAASTTSTVAVADAGYADVAKTTTGGQGGITTELPATGEATDVVVTDETTAEPASDYSERVAAASTTATSPEFTAAAPADPNGTVSSYSENRYDEAGAATGAEGGIVGPDVATGTAVEAVGTTSYVSNTTVGGGEQATAAQTWDTSNGNYQATWASTGGVSGVGGFSVANEQTAPNVGTTAVDGQWSSPDGASSISISGGATLQNYGVHDASGSIEIQTPFGDMQFAF